MSLFLHLHNFFTVLFSASHTFLKAGNEYNFQHSGRGDRYGFLYKPVQLTKSLIAINLSSHK